MIKEFSNWIIGFFVIIILWQASSYLFNPSYLPAPAVVFKSIYINREVHIENLYQTAREAAAGLIISVLISIFFISLIGCISEI